MFFRKTLLKIRAFQLYTVLSYQVVSFGGTIELTKSQFYKIILTSVNFESETNATFPEPSSNLQASGGGGGGGYPVKPGPAREGWRGRLARRLRGCCTHKNLVRRLPVLGWLPGYTLQKGLSDMIAGKTLTNRIPLITSLDRKA